MQRPRSATIAFRDRAGVPSIRRPGRMGLRSNAWPGSAAGFSPAAWKPARPSANAWPETVKFKVSEVQDRTEPTRYRHSFAQVSRCATPVGMAVCVSLPHALRGSASRGGAPAPYGREGIAEGAVKNGQRPDGSKTVWAYYVFPSGSGSAPAQPDSACYQCHLEHEAHRGDRPRRSRLPNPPRGAS